jgi:hypothetical protein
LKSRIGKCFGIIFSTKRSETRAITELINRYRKEPFGHANNKEIRHSGALPEIDMTWIVIVSLGLLTSLRFCRAKWTRLAVHRLNGYDFAVLIRPMMASFKKKCKFCPKLAQQTNQYLYFVGCAPF